MTNQASNKNLNPANLGSIYTNIKKEVPLASQVKYARKQRPPPNFNNMLSDCNNSVDSKNNSPFPMKYGGLAGLGYMTEKFVGSGGFQRILGNDFTFQHEQLPPTANMSSGGYSRFHQEDIYTPITQNVRKSMGEISHFSKRLLSSVHSNGIREETPL